MTTDDEKLRDVDLNSPSFAAVTARYLSRDDALRVANAFMKHPGRAAVLLCAYSGVTMRGDDFAQLALRIAKRLETEGGAAS
jgi:hypothetical protein